MSEEFFEPDIEIDSEELADSQFEYMEAAFPGWVPAAGNLDTWILETGARLGSEVAAIALIVGPEIFRVYGEQIMGMAAVEDVPATATSTWVFSDSLGHTVEAGLIVSIDDLAFEVVNESTVDPGEDTLPDVELVAVDPGQDANGRSGPVLIEEQVDYEATITLVEPTAGGSDGETDDEFQDRIARESELLAPRPLNIRDVELFAKRVPGIETVTVLDNYRPASAPGGESSEVPLTFTVVSKDAAGQPPGAGAKATLLSQLQAARGTNWQIFMMDPQYTIIDVNVEAVAYRDAIPADVELHTIAAVETFLNPALWGQPLYGDVRKWVNTPEVRHRELAAAVDAVDGLDHIPVLEFGIQGTPLTENVDVDLGAGPVRLPVPGEINVTVVAP